MFQQIGIIVNRGIVLRVKTDKDLLFVQRLRNNRINEHRKLTKQIVQGRMQKNDIERIRCAFKKTETMGQRSLMVNSKQVVAAISVVILLLILIYPALSSGSLSISLKSESIPEADHVYVTIKEVWAHRAGQSESQGWELVFNTTKSVDLVSLVNSSDMIKGNAPTAAYDALRVDVSNVTWVFNGTSSNLQPESNQLSSSIDFTVKSSQDLPLIMVIVGRSEILQGQRFFAATLNATLAQP
jgi:hypothetical protein